MANDSKRVDVIVPQEPGEKRGCLEERTNVSTGTLARSQPSTPPDEADPYASCVTATLDSIDGAFERAQAGLMDVEAGRYVRLEEV